MAKLPWMPFYPADYLLDTQPLSIGARGVWMDLICLLWRAEPRGVLSYRMAQWQHILRCTEAELVAVLLEFTTFAICDIETMSNGFVTISSRRMTRDEKERESTRLRVQKFRRNKTGNAAVPKRNRENQNQNQSHSQKLEEEKKETPSRALDALEKFTVEDVTEWLTEEGIDLQAARMAFQEFKDYWRSVGGKRTGGKVIKDWPATFRNRIRELKKDGKIKLVVLIRQRPALVPVEQKRVDPPTSEAKAIMSRLLPTMATVLDKSS